MGPESSAVSACIVRMGQNTGARSSGVPGTTTAVSGKLWEAGVGADEPIAVLLGEGDGGDEG